MALLMGLLLPALGAARHAARKTKAKNEVKNIELAWRAFYDDTRALPPGISEMDSSTIQILRGDNVSLNPSGTRYLEFDDADLGAGFVDPWGGVYQVALDDDGDGTVDAGSYGKLERSVAVWSLGRNGTDDGPDTNNDDIRSWR